MEHGEFELGTDGPSVILVGVDDSVTALRAASYTAGLARRQGARVVAVYVAPIAGMALASSIPPGHAITAARLKSRVRHFLDRRIGMGRLHAAYKPSILS